MADDGGFSEWQQAQILTSLVGATEKLIAERGHLRAHLKAAADCLDEAADLIKDWGAYATDYFAEKHHLSDDIEQIKSAAYVARKAAQEGE